MRSSGPTTCSYAGRAGFLFERSRSALRQSSLARARGVAKRKTRHDDDDDKHDDHARVVIDEFGNRVLFDGLKRLRVSSPPTVDTRPTSPTRDDDDTAMDDDAASIVPVGTRAAPTLTPPAKRALRRLGAVPPALDVADASCRAMVLFDPLQALPIERSPRIQLVDDADASESESDVEQPFVRFEELPDDYEAEPEAMEID